MTLYTELFFPYLSKVHYAHYKNCLNRSDPHNYIPLHHSKDILDDFQSMLKDLNDFGEMFELIEDTRELLEKQTDDRNKEKAESTGVQLMTMHSAKGLEFSHVHIMDVYDGNIPYKKSKTNLELEEERRLLYVAVTRCMDNLYIYIPESAGEKRVKISKFLMDSI